MLAANNSFDKQATIDFHAYVDNNRIPTRVFTKSAAMGARMSPSFFVDLKNTKHPLGIHLQAIQSVMDINFYETACGPVEKRFKAEFDRAWFLKGKTDFNEKAKEFARANPGTTLPFPVGKEVIPYALLLLYDSRCPLSHPFRSQAIPRDMSLLPEFAFFLSHTSSS